MNWHAATAAEVARELRVDPERGLAASEAARRLAEHGRNEIAAEDPVTWPAVLGRQFKEPLVLVLFAAAALAAAIGEWTDAATILVIVVLNGLFGFAQEWRAEKALAALRRMLAARARVVRDGREREIAAADVVPGDVVVLGVGDRVPADLRVAAAFGLRTDESTLTGESVPVEKGAAPVAAGAPLAERAPMTWAGTTVTRGHARGVCVATAMSTEFGRIAQLTSAVAAEPTPLQRKLAVVGRQLGLFALVVSVSIVAAGVAAGKPLFDMVMTGVSLAVAVVPEGLPAVVTITLALGIRAMVRRNALLRRLPAAETLGSAQVICTDKTGTLTKNEMTVRRIWTPAGTSEVSGTGYEASGAVENAEREDVRALLETAVLCNHARLEDGRAIGEPTEAALLVAAAKAGVDPVRSPIDAELPFDPAHKRMAVVRGGVVHAKGAPEAILARCAAVPPGAVDAYRAMARDGLRTLALARRDGDDPDADGLTLLGIVGMLDPPHDEAPGAVALARAAGIRVIMITGDAPETAAAIAERVGIAAAAVITGTDVDRLDDAALRERLRDDVIFARTTPEHKLRIVNALRANGSVVAMTGDGVNDAPALKQADIGIAMGRRGTDVAKGAADLILLDDNFASIIGAVEEGRRQYANIKRFIWYLLSSNTGEVVAIAANLLLGGPLILLPVQILWMNLVTDGPTALALGAEPVAADAMRRPPRVPSEAIFGRRGLLTVLFLGTGIGAVALFLFYRYLPRGGDVARTVAFTGIILAEKLNVLNFRARGGGLRTHRWVWLAIAAAIGLQATALYWPPLQRVLHVVPLDARTWGVMLLAALPIVLLPALWRRLTAAKDAVQEEALVGR